MALGKIIDGKAMAQDVRNEVKETAKALAEQYGKPPGLAVVIVGNRTDSQVSGWFRACSTLSIENSASLDFKHTR